MGEASLRRRFFLNLLTQPVSEFAAFRALGLEARSAVNTMGGGCSRREALGISTLDSESSDRGSNPREVLCAVLFGRFAWSCCGWSLFAVCWFRRRR